MSYISNPVEPAPKRTWLRFVFPVFVILVCGGLTALPWVWNATAEYSDEMLDIFFMTSLAFPLGILLLGIWWLFFSGFRWRTRLGVLALLIIVSPAAWIFGLRKVELTSRDVGLVPVFQYRWEKSLEELYDDFQRAETAKTVEPPVVDLTIGPDDFPRFRGPKMDGVITHIKLETDWVKHPPKVVWRRPCVEGYSGLAVAGNVVITMEQRGAEEAVVCYDRANGRKIWDYRYDAFRKDVMGIGPRATPTIHDGLIFTLGATGQLVCLDAEGNLKWKKDILKEGEAKNIEWGLTGSPLIVDDLVIAHAGVDPDERASKALIAYDYKTGTQRWAVGNRKAGYSSPQLAVLHKVPQILVFDGEALGSFEPKTGKQLWMTPWASKMDMNMIQPVIIGDDQVFITSEPSNGAAMFRVKPPAPDADIWSVETVWKNELLGGRFANPVTDGTRIFGLNALNGQMRCLNVSDGKIRWKGERYGPGQMLLVDDVLLVVSDEGAISLLKPNADAHEVLASFEVFKGKTWNTPALTGDRLFIRNQSEIACIQLPRR